ncbi:DUF6445 family protein [Paucibacter sp. APW11]|uniref:DUF6445 family protein n=1 Tax=Roseateles aquae TaxID=3077235 RepID=A0ABU3PCS9_9BURK|nr:DUF6445 family protein [Paucibacter sp. APW11]MDT8999917.1 DUF6445 family protein [Paucibacter sp. APW11]
MTVTSSTTDRFALRMPPDVRSVRIGDHQVVLIDDFLEDPQALLAEARASRFEPYPKQSAHKGYPGVRAEAPADYTANLVQLVEPLIKLNFKVPEDLPLHKSICAFSLTTMPPDTLGPLQRTPHFDASTPYHMAVLLYLCDGQHGGTGFYRHKATGIQQVTHANRDDYIDCYREELERRPPPARYFDRGDEHFDFLGMLPAKFNRLVVYPGSLLHSACINPSISLSSDPMRGRLTLNSFFDFGIAPPAP